MLEQNEDYYRTSAFISQCVSSHRSNCKTLNYKTPGEKNIGEVFVTLRYAKE